MVQRFLQNKLMKKNISFSVAVIGLGYVGHPLAISFGRKLNTIGYDISKKKILCYRKKIDPNFIFKKKDFQQAKHLTYHYKKNSIFNSNFKIIALPTPVNKKNKPDLSLLIDGCITFSKNLKKNDIVIIESTVNPGTTEEILIPILEKYSKLKYNTDFFVAYCPERINPGDTKNNLQKIVKVISSNNKSITFKVKKLYSLIVNKIHVSENIKTAEAAKIIENTQRDINIALMNELAMLFSKLNININDVLNTASTKWNFLNFFPGLVGGHCVGVDPYYLKYKADQIQFNSRLITSGREVNESLPYYLTNKIINFCNSKKISIKKVNILGATYKENVSDFRNSKVLKMAELLAKKKILVNIHDPYSENKILENIKNIKFFSWKDLPNDADVLIFAVPHEYFLKKKYKEILSKLKVNHLFFDLRYKISKKIVKNFKRYYLSL